MPYSDADKQKEYQKNWMAQRRNDFMSGKSCVKCGGTNKLEIHHRDKETKVSHNIWSWSDKRRNAELAKCDVLCQSCHHEHHKGKTQHGSITMYRYHKCRCEICRAAYSKRAKNWPSRLKLRKGFGL